MPEIPSGPAETLIPVDSPMAERTWSFSTPVTSPPVISPPITSPSAILVPTAAPAIGSLGPELPPIPEAMRRIQKCVSCGFPVSEGRTLCLDCESLERVKIESRNKVREKAALEVRTSEATAGVGESAEAGIDKLSQVEIISNEIKKEDAAVGLSPAPAQDEILPAFLTNPQLVEESWLARHVNLLAFLVLVAAVLVAAVVFFR